MIYPAYVWRDLSDLNIFPLLLDLIHALLGTEVKSYGLHLHKDKTEESGLYIANCSYSDMFGIMGLSHL